MSTFFSELAGYNHPLYAQSLAEFGQPRHLPASNGWILQRPIPGFDSYDAMGCYPLFFCQDWGQLSVDLNNLQAEIVSLTLVTDPFGSFTDKQLRQSFDVVIPFKAHAVADFSLPMNQLVSNHHRKYAQRALRQVTVELCDHPLNYLDEWCHLYQYLVERHQITGLRAFSRQSFAKQLQIPGLVMLRVTHQNQAVGANLIYIQGQVAYGHLSAFSPLGYEIGAAYAVKWRAIELLAPRVKWLSFGASAGVNAGSRNGLSTFKDGWATTTRPTYLCGCIFDRVKYNDLTEAKAISDTTYFPAYRQGEFS